MSVSGPLLLQHQHNARLFDEVAVLRQQSLESERLREEIQRLNAEAQRSAAQRERERAELVRIRGELAAFIARNSKTESPARDEKAGRVSKQTDAAASSASLVRETDWKWHR